MASESPPLPQLTAAPPRRSAAGRLRTTPTAGRITWPRRRRTVAVLLGLVAAVALALRFARLESWPVFLDEDTYTQAAMDMLQLPWPDVLWRSSRYPTLKMPLLFFVQGWLIPLVGDPVLAGRLVPAALGIVSSLLCFELGRRVGGLSVGILASVIYALSPLAVLHERMVLQDGPLTAATLATVLLLWSALERGSWRLAAAAAAAGAIAIQCKVPGLAVIGVLAMLGVATRGPLLSQLRLVGLTTTGPLLSAALVRLTPLGSDLGREDRFVPVHTLAQLRFNVETLLDGVHTYFPLGMSAAVLVGLVLLARERPRVALVFACGLAAWTLPWVLLSPLVSPRYLLPSAPYACVLAALVLFRVHARARRAQSALGWLAGAGGLVLLAASAYGSVQLVFNHRAAPMSALDRWQYQSGWPSGYGYQEAARYIARTAEPGSAVAYVIRPSHQLAAGYGLPLPPGVTSLGLVTVEQPRLNHAGRIYALVDDGRADDSEAGRRPKELLTKEPSLREAVRFTRPGSKTGVSILTTR